MQLINGPLFSSAKDLFYIPIICSFNDNSSINNNNAPLYSHKSDLSIDVFNFLCLLRPYLPSALPD